MLPGPCKAAQVLRRDGIIETLKNGKYLQDAIVVDRQGQQRVLELEDKLEERDRVIEKLRGEMKRAEESSSSSLVAEEAEEAKVDPATMSADEDGHRQLDGELDPEHRSKGAEVKEEENPVDYGTAEEAMGKDDDEGEGGNAGNEKGEKEEKEEKGEKEEKEEDSARRQEQT